jgi:hypothetical protein
MPQRFTLDRKSFEEFLAAASFFQQVQKQALRGGAGTVHGAQPLLVLMETQRAIESGALDLDSAMERIVALTPRAVGGTGAGAWLFTRNEFVCGASRGISPTDERLRLQVLSRLIREFHLESQAEIARLDKLDSGDYPGSIKSLLVAPIYQGPRIAGALAAFSSDLAAFTERDAANLRLLSGLLARALTAAAETGLQKSEALERAALLQLVAQVTPALQELVASTEKTPEITMRSMPDPEVKLEAPGAGADTQATGEDSASPLVTDRGEDAEPGILAGEAEQQAREVEDISVPFIGVRASLGSEIQVEEPSNFWPSLHERWQRSSAPVRQGAVSIWRELQRSSGKIGGTGRSLFRTLKHGTHYRPALPAFPTEAFRRRMRWMQLWMRQAFEQTARNLSHAAKRIPAPAMPRLTLPAGWSSIRLRLSAAWERAGAELRKLSWRINQWISRLDLSRAPEADVKKHLQQVEARVSNVAERTSAWLQAAGQRRIRVRLALPSLALNRKAMRKSAPAWAVLVIMISFLMLELGLLRSWTIAATAQDTSSPDVVTVPSAAEHPSSDSFATPSGSEEQSSGKSSDSESSHLRITDPASEAYLRDMTRYETPTLRRRAEYGDDIAAFQLGMAYEVGYGVSQNCARAAEWVRQAAENGNAAAEFNLGLRYRDGDGVTPDPEQANKWLRRAYAHKYSAAHGALVAMNSN